MALLKSSSSPQNPSPVHLIDTQRPAAMGEPQAAHQRHFPSRKKSLDCQNKYMARKPNRSRKTSRRMNFDSTSSALSSNTNNPAKAAATLEREIRRVSRYINGTRSDPNRP